MNAIVLCLWHWEPWSCASCFTPSLKGKWTLSESNSGYLNGSNFRWYHDRQCPNSRAVHLTGLFPTTPTFKPVLLEQQLRKLLTLENYSFNEKLRIFNKLMRILLSSKMQIIRFMPDKWNDFMWPPDEFGRRKFDCGAETRKSGSAPHVGQVSVCCTRWERIRERHPGWEQTRRKNIHLPLTGEFIFNSCFHWFRSSSLCMYDDWREWNWMP